MDYNKDLALEELIQYGISFRKSSVLSSQPLTPYKADVWWEKKLASPFYNPPTLTLTLGIDTTTYGFMNRSEQEVIFDSLD